MKYKKLIYLALFLLFLSTARAEIIFNETFTGLDSNGWLTSLYVINMTRNGTSLLLTGSGGEGNVYRYGDINVSGANEITWYYKQETDMTGANFQMGVYLTNAGTFPNDNQGNFSVNCNFLADNDIECLNSSTAVEIENSVALNTIYKVKYIVNHTSRTFEVELNDVSKGIFNYRYGGFEVLAIRYKQYTGSKKSVIEGIFLNKTEGLPTGAGVTPAFTLATNLTAYINATNNPFTFSISGTDYVNITPVFNCSMYMNDTLNITAQDININNTDNIFNLTYGDEENAYNINVTCSRLEQGYYLTRSFLRQNIFLDSIQPDLSLTGVSNGLQLYKNDTASSFYWNLTITDVNLLAVNITLLNTTNSSLVNIFNTSLINTTFSNYTAYNMQEQPAGVYVFHVQAWDDHNPIIDEHEKIKKLDFKEGNATIEFNGGYFNLLDPNMKEYELLDEDNKYKEKFKFNDLSGVMVVSSNTPLVYRLTEHKAHFVSIGLNKYRDLDHPSIIINNVEKVSDYKYLVYYDLLEKNIITNSIGDLNTLDNYYNITLNEGFQLFVKDYNTNLSLDAFTAVITNGTVTQTLNGVTGFTPVNLTGIYNVSLNASNFINTTTLNVNFTDGGTITLYMNATNAFIVYIRDQFTNALIQPQGVDLEFIGTNSSNYSTTTGFKYIYDLAPDDYIIRYSSPNYTNAFYYFTLENGTNVQFTIYMLINTSADEVTATVIDELNNELEGAYIHVQRYDLLTNSYRTVEIVKTNFEGDAIIHVTKETEFYKFLIYYNGELKKETGATYIYEDSITFQISLFGDVGEEFYTTQAINWDLTFNTATKNYNFDFSSSGGTITKGELFLYNVSAGIETLHNYSSVDAASGTLLLTAQNVSGRTYLAKAYVTIDGDIIFLGSLYYYYPASEPPSDTKNSNLFYVGLLTLLFITLGFWNISIAVLLAPLPLIFASIMKLIPLPVYVTAPLEVAALILVYILNKNG